jgi:hypothetical protein
LIQLIGSLRAVAPELYGSAVAFLAWLIPHTEHYDDIEELGFLMIGLLWLALHVPALISDDAVATLSVRIAAEAKHAFEEDRGPHSERWLLGTTFYNQQHADWEHLGQELLELDIHYRGLRAREWVNLIGSELVGLSKLPKP